MSEIKYCVGVDIASDTFAASVGQLPWKLVIRPETFENTEDGYSLLLEWLEKHHLPASQTIVCMEATGVYCEGLAYFLHAKGHRVAVEPPLKVKRAFKPFGRKNDAVDSEPISEYACRHVDELSWWTPRSEILEQVRAKGIGRAFQVVKPFPDMTVLENTMVGAFSKVDKAGEAQLKAMEVLDFVRLSPKKSLLAKNLTIADKKRLELARALATEPSLLLLDEVMSGLTPKETEETISLIRVIQEHGITLFIIEHVMRVIMTLSDRVAIIHHGSKIAEGIPKEVAQDERVIKAYLGEAYVFARN